MADRPTIGYLCTYVPEEIIHAAGFAPIRIMPDTAPATRADAHLQSYTCGLARSCLNQALAGRLDSFSGVAFAHTCDTMQGLADIWHYAFPNLFVDTVVGPVALNSPHAKAYLVAELRRFVASLEKHFQIHVAEDSLRASIRLYNQRRRALADFYARRDSYIAVEWFNTMTAALTTPPESLTPSSSAGPISNLQSLISSPQSPISSPQSRIILVGSTLDEPTLPQILDEQRARIVADDLCNGTRYFDTLVAEEGDPIQALAERQLARVACPCKHRSLDHRAEHLLNLVREHRAEGVIFCLKKFCDPHAWDYVPLAAALDRVKVPHLLLETEQATPAGQMRVRVEAFLEMLTS
jgi:bzd-type benzoyl-CoA reductase N subunit